MASWAVTGLLESDVDYHEACVDLAWLTERGALVGVAEIIRERRRQVDAGRTVEHDDENVHGGLVTMAVIRINQLRKSRLEGTSDLGSDEDGLRKAGALCAAETDRLFRLAGGVKLWTSGAWTSAAS